MNDLEVPGTSGLTYFNTLSDDVPVKLLECLDRIWFDRSKDEEYLDTVPLDYGRTAYLYLLLSEDGPFYDVASSLLTRVSFTHVHGSTNVMIRGGQVEIGPELFENEEVEQGLAEKLLKMCGESAKVISLTTYEGTSLDSENDGSGLVGQFISLVIQYCTAVDSLEFDFTSPNGEFVSPLFAKFSAQLRSISWHLWAPGDCFCLPDFSDCTQIRQLFLNASPELMPVLERAGSQVESFLLTIDTFEICGEIIDAIEQNCKKLMHIELGNTRHIINSVGEERYAAFLCSYGNQLIEAGLCGMVEPEHLEEVYTKCSNLKAEYQMVDDYGVEAWELIRVFAPRIRFLRVDLMASTGEESSNAISSCTSLSELYLTVDGERREQDVIDSAVMSVLSSLSTPSLKHLTLTEFRATKENVAVIVAATSNLVRMELALAEPVQDGTIFKTIVDSNPHLCEVEIAENSYPSRERDGDSAVELLRVLVDTFSKCRSLMFCLLGPDACVLQEETIRDICGSLPCRGIDLFVEIGPSIYIQNIF